MVTVETRHVAIGLEDNGIVAVRLGVLRLPGADYGVFISVDVMFVKAMRLEPSHNIQGPVITSASGCTTPRPG